MAKIPIAHGVAAGFLAAPEWRADQMANSAQAVFFEKQVWILSLAETCCLRFETRPQLAELEKFISRDSVFRKALKNNNIKSIRSLKILRPKNVISLNWDLPEIPRLRDLANWLGIRIVDVQWLANLHKSHQSSKDVCGKHYVCRWFRKRSSGLRLIESPKPFLKDAQRQIQQEILAKIKPHFAAHGFTTGRSVLTFVAPHAGKPVCLKMDLKDFFPSIGFGRVHGLFRLAGYSSDVSRHLAGLCTCVTSSDEFERIPLGLPNVGRATFRLFSQRHLPQGAPTSPTLANLIAFRLDARLQGLATSAGFEFTRYADDLLFSGGRGLARSSKQFQQTVGAIAWEEGFELQYRKTRLMLASQRQLVTGLTINRAANLPRPEYDQLKATLFNCIRNGPAIENRSSIVNFQQHLVGRMEWVRQFNPVKARKLQALFSQIDWS